MTLRDSFDYKGKVFMAAGMTERLSTNLTVGEALVIGVPDASRPSSSSVNPSNRSKRLKMTPDLILCPYSMAPKALVLNVSFRYLQKGLDLVSLMCALEMDVRRAKHYQYTEGLPGLDQ